MAPGARGLNTGYRPGEGAGLMPVEIVPEANIPLTGVSLEAFRQARNGFPRHTSNSAALGGTANTKLLVFEMMERSPALHLL